MAFISALSLLSKDMISDSAMTVAPGLVAQASAEVTRYVEEIAKKRAQGQSKPVAKEETGVTNKEAPGTLIQDRRKSLHFLKTNGTPKHKSSIFRLQAGPPPERGAGYESGPVVL
jgi:hypothetical protein